MSFPRLTINRETANPLTLPVTPRASSDLLKKFPQMAQLDAAWSAWRNQAQNQLSQAIMALKLDPGNGSASTTATTGTDLSAAAQKQIDDITKQMEQASNTLSQLTIKVSNLQFDVTQAAAPVQDGLNELKSQLGQKFEFNSPSTTWVANHTMDRTPSVDVYRNDSTRLLSNVVHTGAKQVTVQHNFPLSGYVILR